jgi:hypothetical protein
MTKILNIDLNDEVVMQFSYDIVHKKIEVFFSGYYDLEKEEYQEKPCTLIIEKWSDAKARNSGEPRFKELNKRIGVFDILYKIEVNDGMLELLLETRDSRFVELLFENATVRVEFP